MCARLVPDPICVVVVWETRRERREEKWEKSKKNEWSAVIGCSRDHLFSARSLASHSSQPVVAHLHPILSPQPASQPASQPDTRTHSQHQMYLCLTSPHLNLAIEFSSRGATTSQRDHCLALKWRESCISRVEDPQGQNKTKKVG